MKLCTAWKMFCYIDLTFHLIIPYTSDKPAKMTRCGLMNYFGSVNSNTIATASDNEIAIWE